MGKKRFLLRIHAEVLLGEDDIWPDGDAPIQPTPEHVRELIDSDGGIVTVLADWGLHDDVDWEVLER